MFTYFDLFLILIFLHIFHLFFWSFLSSIDILVFNYLKLKVFKLFKYQLCHNNSYTCPYNKLFDLNLYEHICDIEKAHNSLKPYNIICINLLQNDAYHHVHRLIILYSSISSKQQCLILFPNYVIVHSNSYINLSLDKECLNVHT